jgi:hypothetical protein
LPERHLPRPIGQEIIETGRHNDFVTPRLSGDPAVHFQISCCKISALIMKYNPAEAYALAIGHLADRLRSLVQAWPRDQRVLTLDERYEMQERLSRRGFDSGEPDGMLGPRTRLAIRRFQASIGEVPDGFASSGLLDRLRQP